MRLPLVFSIALTLAACGQKQAGKRMEEKLKAEEARKVEQKKKNDEADAKRFAPAPEEKITLPSPYNDTDGTLISDEGQCPEGLWTLFKGDVPGATKEEKKANEAKRGELMKALKEKTFLVKLRPPAVDLKEWDGPKGEYPLEVAGSIECQDSIGHISITWTPAKAGDPGNSAAKQDADVTQNYWMADKVKFAIPFKTLNEAKEWRKTSGLSLKARVVFKLTKGEIDHKYKKIAKVTEKAAGETISIGGGMEDWGAGRMVKAELIGLRVAANKEKDQIGEKKGDSK